MVRGPWMAPAQKQSVLNGSCSLCCLLPGICYRWLGLGYDTVHCGFGAGCTWIVMCEIALNLWGCHSWAPCLTEILCDVVDRASCTPMAHRRGRGPCQKHSSESHASTTLQGTLKASHRDLGRLSHCWCTARQHQDNPKYWLWSNGHCSGQAAFVWPPTVHLCHAHVLATLEYWQNVVLGYQLWFFTYRNVLAAHFFNYICLWCVSKHSELWYVSLC